MSIADESDYRQPLERYLRERFPELQGLTIAGMSLLPRGASNETYRLRMEHREGAKSVAQDFVLRPQRAEGILEPYDIARQYRVMAALQESEVPVPRLLCLEESGDVLGMPFFIMQYVDAEEPPFLWQDETSDPRIDSHARTLRRIHEVDWPGRGLAFLGEPAGAEAAVEQEIDTWLERARLNAGSVEERLRGLASWLRTNNAGWGPAVLIHGDPNPGNYLFRGADVVAVIDWELAAISDSRSDLGFYLAIQTLFLGLMGGTPNDAFVRAYERAFGEPLRDLAYFEALGLFKLATVALRLPQFETVRPYLEQALFSRVEKICGPLPAA